MASTGGEPKEGFGSRIFSSSLEDGRGKAGDIEINARQINILDGAQIGGGTFGLGDGGSIKIKAETGFGGKGSWLNPVFGNHLINLCHKKRLKSAMIIDDSFENFLRGLSFRRWV